MSLGTIFSDCGVYRYTLERTWVPTPLRYCLFIMLNPSTADAENNDPTINRCIDYAKRWGYDGLYVGNLYALRATQPAALWFHHRIGTDIVGPENNMWLRKMARKSEIVVGAWGTQAETERAQEVRILLNLARPVPIHHLKLCKNGMPAHPLYLKNNLKPKLWRPK